jgi:Zn-dependent protease
MDVNSLVQTVAIYALPVLFAITLHEAAHGYVARHFGDMTAHAEGRISLNPMRHIDPVGTIVVPLVILVASSLAGGSGLLFGWAKPVPVNYSALKKPREHMALVAAAGPGANLAMAILWVLVLRICIGLSDRSVAWMDIANSHGIGALIDVAKAQGSSLNEALIGMSAAGVLVNLVLMLLNLLPILPLDGGRIVASLLPRRAAWQFSKLEPWGLPLLLLLMFVPIYGSSALSLILAPLLYESDALIRALVL